MITIRFVKDTSAAIIDLWNAGYAAKEVARETLEVKTNDIIAANYVCRPYIENVIILLLTDKGISLYIGKRTEHQTEDDYNLNIAGADQKVAELIFLGARVSHPSYTTITNIGV